MLRPIPSSLCAAVMTFLVPLEMRVLEVSGMMPQDPMNLLFWSRIRQVQGNSYGEVSARCRPPTRLSDQVTKYELRKIQGSNSLKKSSYL